MTLLHTPYSIKTCRIEVNIYFRSLGACRDVRNLGMEIWLFVDLMSDPAKRLNNISKITYYFQLLSILWIDFVTNKLTH